MKMRKFLNGVLACTMVTSLSITSLASNNEGIHPEEEIAYEETKVQINLQNIDFSLDEDGMPSFSTGIDTQYDLMECSSNVNDFETLEEFLSRNPDLQDMLLDSIAEDNTLIAFSITEVPLIWNENQYERIPVNSKSVDKEDTDSVSNYFTLTTSLYSSGLLVNGRESYMVITTGEWAKATGSNISTPSSGQDFVTQVTPSTFSVESYKSTFVPKYTLLPSGGTVTGSRSDYSMYATNRNNAVGCHYNDVSSALRVGKSFSYKNHFTSNPSTNIKRVVASYAHTWNKCEVRPIYGNDVHGSTISGYSTSNSSWWDVENSIFFH